MCAISVDLQSTLQFRHVREGQHAAVSVMFVEYFAKYFVKHQLTCKAHYNRHMPDKGNLVQSLVDVCNLS